MAVLREKNTAPPDGWIFVEMRTKTTIEGEFLKELVDKVIAHRAWKNLEPRDVESVTAEVQRQICLGLSPLYCIAEPGEDYQPIVDQSRSITLAKIMSFSAALIEWLTSREKMVDAEEAQRRTEICRGCRFNRQPGACSCAPLYKMLDALIPSARRMAGVHVCGVCGCSLAAKILAPESAVRFSNEGRHLRFPSYCWQQNLA